MAVKTACPHCDTVYNLADATIGKKVRCKKCNEAFTVEDVPVAEEQIQPEERGRLRSAPARLRDEDEDDFDDDRPSRRPRRPLRKSSSSDFPVLAVTLIAGGVVLAAVLIVVGAWLFMSRQPPAGPPQAAAPQPVNAQPQNPPLQAAANPQAAPPQGLPVTDKAILLFNGKVTQDFPRPGLRFSVEYKFQKGGPAPGQHYFWVIEPEHGDGYEVRLNWTELGKEDTLKASTIMPGFGARGPFTMSIQMGQFPGGLGRRGRETISNKLVVDMPAGANAPQMPGIPGNGLPPGAQAAPPPRIERKALDDAEITGILADLASGERSRIQLACAKLGTSLPGNRRDEVAKALEKLLADTDAFHRQFAAQALATWGTKDNVPALIKAADDTNFATRWAVLEALAAMKDARASAKLAEHLADHGDRIHASKGLQAIGAAAEKDVAKSLKHQDWGVRLEACHILKTIGTKDSLDALRAAQQDENGLVKMAADEAARACAGR
jgi:predicted Zn finger-like uncharacterized protein